MKINIEEFENFLKEKNLSKNTLEQHLRSIKQFYQKFKRKELNKKTINEYKTWLMDNFSPKTVNVRITGINSYLKFIHKFEELKVEQLKIQQKPFLEDVISEADYEFLKNILKKNNDLKGYFMIRFLGATGARISEFLKLKIEHVKRGYFDIYGKGTKFRRILIPKKLQQEALDWFKKENRSSGYLFENEKTKQSLTSRGVSSRLQFYAKKYNIDKNVMHPHSFRHRFAKSFIDRYKDICFLADLLGHESIDTTRIYVRKTATEQREIVDNIVDW